MLLTVAVVVVVVVVVVVLQVVLGLLILLLQFICWKSVLHFPKRFSQYIGSAITP